MLVKDLEQRVAILEREIQRLSGELAAARTGRTKNWLSAVEKFTGDEGLLSLFADALKLREQDRKRARVKLPTEHKPKT